MKNEDIARVCHEVNRAYCMALGDDSQLPWNETSDSLRSSAMDGVEFHLKDERTPEESHNAWLEFKVNEGYVFGELKNDELKIHPCIVPFSELPVEQRVKDYLFKSVVDSMKTIVVEPDVIVTPAKYIGMTPVKYIGIRPEHTDYNYGTLVKWVKDEIHMIPDSTAKRMLVHTDVYALGEHDVPSTPDIPDIPDTDEDDDNASQSVKDAVSNMRSKQSVRDFAAANYSGMPLTSPDKLVDLKREVHGLIDQYGVVK